MRVDFDYVGLNKSGKPGRSFEQYVGVLLRTLGCHATFTGAEGTSEKGADWIATRWTELFPEEFEVTKWGVQCKCVARPGRHVQDIENQLRRMVRSRCCKNLLLVLATDPSSEFREQLKRWAKVERVKILIWGKAELDSLASRYPRLRDWLFDRHPAEHDPLEVRYDQFLYHLGPNCARAIRLLGADDECFPMRVVRVTPDRARYSMPLEFSEVRAKVLEGLRAKARRANTMFYDGPHTRLVDYHATPVEKSEQKHLELVLGPIGWYDYSVANELFSRVLRSGSAEDMLEYLDLDRIAHDGNIRGVRLSNILDTATTIVTSDGMALYTERSGRVSTAARLLTCSVAENIHTVKDGSLGAQGKRGAPAPFRTVWRGIEEELSPRVRKIAGERSTFLVGLSFDLREFHPDLLFAVFLDRPCEEILDICRDSPGKDFVEGHLKAVPAVSGSRSLSASLSRANWVPAGKASLIRAVEFLEAMAIRSSMSLRQTISALAEGLVPKI